MKKHVLAGICGALLAAGCAGTGEQRDAKATAQLEPRSGSIVTG